MSLPLLGLILLLLLKSVYTSMEMSQLSCDHYWELSTYMEADIILGTFIPIYIPLDLPQNVQNIFHRKPSLLWKAFLSRWKNYQILLTIYFAIEEINKDSQLLPNMTMGFHIYNAFNSNKRTLEGPLMFFSGRSDYIPNYKCKTQHKALGIISGSRPEFSAAIGTLLELYKVPQVSFSLLLQVTYGPFDTELSDKVTFPSLYQMSPKDRGLTHGVISLLLYFGWNWVGNFFRGSISFSKTRIIPGFKNFLEDLTPSQYPGDFDFFKFWIDKILCSPPALHCKYPKPCPANISLRIKHDKIDLMTISESSYSIWNAVYAVTHALHKMLLSKTEMGSKEDRNTDCLLPWQLHPFLRKIKVTNAAGDEISFDENKNIIEMYDIQNFVEHAKHNSLLVKVGEFVFKSPQDQGFFINEVLIKWPRNFNQTPQSVCAQSCGPGFWKVPQEERPVCCFSCVFCPEQHISN
nr:vomeronasal type-2 receptor 26-like [Meriones unguiculatus]